MCRLNIYHKIIRYALKLSKHASQSNVLASFAVSLNFVEFIKGKIQFFTENEEKITKYWERQTVKEAILQADKYFENHDFMEVYESLNRIKYSKDIEIVWRIAKALFHLSQMEKIEHSIRKEMISEAYEVLQSSSDIGEGKANYHKWKAIVLNEKYGLESVENRIKHYSEVKDHLLRACELNPKDFTVRYILGKWCYEMANLTWFQRLIAKYLYLEPPDSSYQEAFRHLSIAEEISPRSFVPNIFMLGNVCIKLGQYYRAKYFLNMVLSLPTHGCGYEKCCLSNAKHLLEKLNKYDLGKDLLCEGWSFGFDN